MDTRWTFGKKVNNPFRFYLKSHQLTFLGTFDFEAIIKSLTTPPKVAVSPKVPPPDPEVETEPEIIEVDDNSANFLGTDLTMEELEDMGFDVDLDADIISISSSPLECLISEHHQDKNKQEDQMELVKSLVLRGETINLSLTGVKLATVKDLLRTHGPLDGPNEIRFIRAEESHNGDLVLHEQREDSKRPLLEALYKNLSCYLEHFKPTEKGYLHCNFDSELSDAKFPDPDLCWLSEDTWTQMGRRVGRSASLFQFADFIVFVNPKRYGKAVSRFLHDQCRMLLTIDATDGFTVLHKRSQTEFERLDSDSWTDLDGDALFPGFHFGKSVQEKAALRDCGSTMETPLCSRCRQAFNDLHSLNRHMENDHQTHF
jgi:hypothetical protein